MPAQRMTTSSCRPTVRKRSVPGRDGLRTMSDQQQKLASTTMDHLSRGRTMPSRFGGVAHVWSALTRTRVTALSACMALLGALFQPVVPAGAPSVALAQSSNMHPHWMADNQAAIQQRELGQLILPGTHDAGSYHFECGLNPLTLGLTQTQDQSIYNQLMLGIRYFDLRVRYVTGRYDPNDVVKPACTQLPDDYYIEHDTVNTDVKLVDIIDDIARFYGDVNNQEEFVFLDFSGKGAADAEFDNYNDDTTNRLQQVCDRFQKELGPYLIDPSMVPPGTDLGHMTINDFLAMPGTPRIITNLGGCTQSGFWPTELIGGYYASQCQAEPDSILGPGIIRDDGAALNSRITGNGAGNPSSGTPTMWFYGLSIASTPLCPHASLYEQEISSGSENDVLSSLVTWFGLNQPTGQTTNNARKYLNLVYGDYVQDTPLVIDAIGMNAGAGPTVKIDGSIVSPQSGSPIPAGQSFSVSCIGDKFYGPATLEVSGQPNLGQKLQNGVLSAQPTVVDPPDGSHVQFVTCTDASGRAARVTIPVAHAAAATPVWSVNANGDVLYLDGTNKWTTVQGGGSRIAVAPDGQPWVTNKTGEVWRRLKGSTGYRDGIWVKVAPANTASDIAIGGEGSVWALGFADQSGGTNHAILHLDKSNLKTDSDPSFTSTFTVQNSGGGTDIAVGLDGQPWVVNAAGELWRETRNTNVQWIPDGWAQTFLSDKWINVTPDGANVTNVAVGPYGSAWVVENGGNGAVLHFDPVAATWTQLSGAATRLAADAHGVWSINNQGQVYRYTNSSGGWLPIDLELGAGAFGVSDSLIGSY